MGALDAETVTKALSDSNPYMRLAGVRGAEPFLAKGDGALQAAVLKLSDDANADVRRQLAASLGEIAARRPRGSGGRHAAQIWQ